MGNYIYLIDSMSLMIIYYLIVFACTMIFSSILTQFYDRFTSQTMSTIFLENVFFFFVRLSRNTIRLLSRRCHIKIRPKRIHNKLYKFDVQFKHNVKFVDRLDRVYCEWLFYQDIFYSHNFLFCKSCHLGMVYLFDRFNVFFNDNILFNSFWYKIDDFFKYSEPNFTIDSAATHKIETMSTIFLENGLFFSSFQLFSHYFTSVIQKTKIHLKHFL